MLAVLGRWTPRRASRRWGPLTTSTTALAGRHKLRPCACSAATATTTRRWPPTTATVLPQHLFDRRRQVLASSTRPTPGLRDETWQGLKQHTFDAVIMEDDGLWSQRRHMNADDVIYYRGAFEAEGLLRPGALFIAQHFSHGHNPPYEELCALFGPHDIAVAYDGWKLDI